MEASFGCDEIPKLKPAALNRDQAVADEQVRRVERRATDHLVMDDRFRLPLSPRWDRERPDQRGRYDHNQFGLAAAQKAASLPEPAIQSRSGIGGPWDL